MKNIFATLLFALPALAVAQNHVLEGKAYQTKPTEGVEKTITGAFAFTSHVTLAFAKDSVTFISYRKDADKDQPEVIKTRYKYAYKDSGVYIDTPNQGHYFFNNDVLVSDCKYDTGKKYYEVASD